MERRELLAAASLSMGVLGGCLGDEVLTHRRDHPTVRRPSRHLAVVLSAGHTRQMVPLAISQPFRMALSTSVVALMAEPPATETTSSRREARTSTPLQQILATNSGGTRQPQASHQLRSPETVPSSSGGAPAHTALLSGSCASMTAGLSRLVIRRRPPSTVTLFAPWTAVVERLRSQSAMGANADTGTCDRLRMDLACPTRSCIWNPNRRIKTGITRSSR